MGTSEGFYTALLLNGKEVMVWANDYEAEEAAPGVLHVMFLQGSEAEPIVVAEVCASAVYDPLSRHQYA